MSEELVALVIYDSKLFSLSGHVSRWAHSVSAAYTRNAIAEAPVNKRARKSSWYPEYPVGSLKASISGDAEKIAPKHWQIIIMVDVPYAMWVIDGTEAYITPTQAKTMDLPPNPGFGVGRRQIVRGQSGNDFMSRAHDATAVTHPSLRGMRNALFEQF